MASIEAKSDVSGSVWKIEVAEGQAVEEGDTLVIIESMKMEIPVLAEASGTVARIMVAESQPVTEGQAVILLTT